MKGTTMLLLWSILAIASCVLAAYAVRVEVLARRRRRRLAVAMRSLAAALDEASVWLSHFSAVDLPLATEAADSLARALHAHTKFDRS
jgi:uncharacterized SAM-binding protein YcdF (DUF218 family)